MRMRTELLKKSMLCLQALFSKSHLEMSPQYHSASVSRLLVSVTVDGAIFDLAGFAGRTEKRE